MIDPVDLLDDKGADSLLQRLYKRLAPGSHFPVGNVHPNADDAEELPFVVGDFRVGPMPSGELVHRFVADEQVVSGFQAGQPRQNLLHGKQPVFRPGRCKHVPTERGEPGQVAFRRDVIRVVDSGKDRTGVHVHQVVPVHELLDLTDGHPAEVGQHFEVVLDLDDDIAVPFPEEACALFGLELVQEDAFRPRLGEILQVGGTLPLVDAGVIALGGLEGGADLDTVHVAGFDLRLHQEVQDAVEFLGQDAQVTDFRLDDDRLVPGVYEPIVRFHMNALDTEEPPGDVTQIPVFVQPPSFHVPEGNGLDGNANLPVPLLDPSQEVFRTVEPVFCSKE